MKMTNNAPHIVTKHEPIDPKTQA